jgi:hypothetical protein
MHPDSDCDVLDMVGKIRRLSNQPNWFHPKIRWSQQESLKKSAFRLCFGAATQSVGPCIALEPIRGESRDHARPNNIFIQQPPPH